MANIDFAKLDELLGSVNLSAVTEEGVKSELPDGYYLCQVDKAKLTESKSGNAMFAIQFTTIEDGKKSFVNEAGYTELIVAPKTANQRIYVNYVLSNDMNVNFFVSDMLKFQDIDTNVSFFTKDDFKSSEGIERVGDLLESGGIIYIMVQSVAKRDNPNETEKKYKPISWKRAHDLGLI